MEPDRELRLTVTQNNPPSWGLDRIDQSDLPLDNAYTYEYDGSGVNIYIIDTGLRISHNDFGGRARYVSGGTNGDFVGDGRGNAEDCHGHGTHVGGTAAGSGYGVAKNANLWALRVLNCEGSGSTSGVIAAVDWVTGSHQDPAVANMSLGGSSSSSLNNAVANSVAAGVPYAVSAGNGNAFGTPQNACNQSPAGTASAITVGATESDDDEASFSNYGSCVDILAPGVSITSAWNTGNNATAVLSGTSMASPHVAGAAALVLQTNPSYSPSQVVDALTDNASSGTIDLHSRSRRFGTDNLLLNTQFLGGGGGGGPGNQAPTADFSASCTDLTCAFTDASDDADGTVASWSWTFGDGGSSPDQSPTHSYTTAGTYTVTLTVTDNDNATDTASQAVTVSEGGGGEPSDISLSVSPRSFGNFKGATLSWDGANGSQVDISRDGVVVATTNNDGSFFDRIGANSATSFVYQVCEAGTSTCSNEATANF